MRTINNFNNMNRYLQLSYIRKKHFLSQISQMQSILIANDILIEFIFLPLIRLLDILNLCHKLTNVLFVNHDKCINNYK